MAIKVIVPQSDIVAKDLKTKKGEEFTIFGIQVGDKFLRLVHAREHTYPDGDLECNLYARKYTTARGEFSELALFITNTLPPVTTDDESVDDESDVPF